jgi:hypothetical protein
MSVDSLVACKIEEHREIEARAADRYAADTLYCKFCVR